MKKIFVLASALVLSSSVFAAGTGKALSAGPNTTTVATTDCDALNEDVKVNLSKNNVGNVACSTTGIGVAVASTAGKATGGKGTMYQSNSSGGAIDEVQCTAAACAQSDVDDTTNGSAKALAKTNS